MRKQITISGKEYFAKSSAYTQFKYKNDTGRGMLSDLQTFANSKDIDNDMLNNVDGITEMILKMAYIMIEEADKNQVTNYEDFLKGLDGLYDDTTWISDVLELAASPFSRGIQTTPQDQQQK